MKRAMATPPKGIGETAIDEFERYCDCVVTHYTVTSPTIPPPTQLDILFSLTDDTWLNEGTPKAADSIRPRQRKALASFSEQMRSIYGVGRTSPVQQLLSHVVDSLQLLQYFEKTSKTTAEYEEREANIRELQKASAHVTEGGPSLGTGSIPDQSDEIEMDFVMSPLATFLEDIALVTDLADTSKENSERFVVALMTIHASKGMEFDSVYLIGNEEKTFPSAQSCDDSSGLALEEEKRLCYVAMTRAKSELIMTWRKEVIGFGSQGMYEAKRSRSRFLEVLVSSSTPNRKNHRVAPARSYTTKSVYSAPDSEAKWKSGDQSMMLARPRAAKESSATTNVYMESSISSFDNTRKDVSTVKHRQSYTSPQLRETSSVPNAGRMNRNKNSRRGSDRVVTRTATGAEHSRVPRSQHFKRRAKNTPAKAAVDATWFYPVGSKVHHKDFGRGIVLEKQQPTGDVDMPVLVKFSSGEQHVCCGRGSDLSPIV